MGILSEITRRMIMLGGDTPSTLLNGIVSYYKFQETTGIVVDELGVNDGSLVGAVSRGAVGKIDNGFDFTNSWVNIPDNASLDFTTEFSVSLWCKPDSFSAYMGIMAKGDAADSGSNSAWVIRRWSATNTIQARLFGTVDGNVLSSDFIDGAWNHIVLVFNGIDVRMYVNNNLTIGDAFVGPIHNSTDPVEIGRNEFGGQRNFDGDIDEIGIWDRGLTASEVDELYNNTVGNQYPFATRQPYVVENLDFAYSFKKRVATATKSFRIRRSSDNAETDVLLHDYLTCSIYSEVSAGGTLATWIGSDDGFVVTDYDQTGNYDMTQATTTKQPKVVNVGTWLGYKDYDGTDDIMNATTMPTSTNGTAYLKVNGATNAVQYFLSQTNPALWSIFVFGTNTSTGYDQRLIDFTGTNTVNQSIGASVLLSTTNILTYRSSGTAYTLRQNSVNNSIQQTGSNFGNWFGDRTTGYVLHKGGIIWNNGPDGITAFEDYEMLSFNVTHTDAEALVIEDSIRYNDGGVPNPN